MFKDGKKHRVLPKRHIPPSTDGRGFGSVSMEIPRSQNAVLVIKRGRLRTAAGAGWAWARPHARCLKKLEVGLRVVFFQRRWRANGNRPRRVHPAYV